MPDSSQKKARRSLLIQANFAPSRGGRFLRILVRGFGLLMLAMIVLFIGVYGFSVNLESAIGKLSREARAVYEQNKELQVRLNRLQSFQNVTTAASRVPHLKPAEDVLTVQGPLSPQPDWQAPSQRPEQEALPQVYGY